MHDQVRQLTKGLITIPCRHILDAGVIGAMKLLVSAKRHWPLGLLALVILAASGALVFTLTPGSRAPTQIALDGIPERDLSEFGVQLLQPDRAPTIDAVAAELTAKTGLPDGAPTVKETVLVRVVNDRADPPMDTVAWAVTFDSLTINAVPPLGSGQYNFCGHPLYSVVFIDAGSGEFLLGTQRSTLNGSESQADCPQPDTPGAPTPAPTP